MKEVQSVALPGLTVGHDLFWANHKAKPATEWASSVDPSLSLENQSFSQSTMPSSVEYCSPLMGWCHSITSVSDYVVSKALNIIGISNSKAKAQDLLLSHRRQVGDLNFLTAFSSLTLLTNSRMHTFFQ